MHLKVDNAELQSEEERALEKKFYLCIHSLPMHVGSNAGIHDGDVWVEFPLGVYKNRRAFVRGFNRASKEYEARMGTSPDTVYFVKKVTQ
jgi:hypothetical protein